MAGSDRDTPTAVLLVSVLQNKGQREGDRGATIVVTSPVWTS